MLDPLVSIDTPIIGTTLRDILTKPDHQQVSYNNPRYAFNTVATLYEEVMPLTSKVEIAELKENLVAATQKDKLIIQAGLCVEEMDMPRADRISYAAHASVMINNLSLTVEQETGKETISILRGAGQLAKPRSEIFEQDGTTYTYRGPLTHSATDRDPDPKRLNEAYRFSKEVKDVVDVYPGRKIYTSHEALSLPYELALSQPEFAGSSPVLWIGNRTRRLNGPHVALGKDISNPVELKIDDKLEPEELSALLTTLNPQQESGKIVVICRYGNDKIDKLGPNLEVIKEFGDQVNVICDVMHGNTKIDPASGKKTRYTEDMKNEAIGFVAQCRAHGVHPAGLHMEVSAADVTECMGDGVDDLHDNYQSLIDPCLNPHQAQQIVKTFAAAYKVA